jgi:DNA-binding NtrC family response regulator
LNVIPLRSPSLRERVDDIPLLAKSFLEEFSREYGGRAKPTDPVIFEMLQARAWPGNVRELRNVIERMVILAGPEIRPEDVPMPGVQRTAPPPVAAAPPPPAPPDGPPPASSIGIVLPGGEPLSLRDFRDRAESEYIRMTLKACDWNISRAATQLGVERTNLHKKMRALRIARD